VTSLAAFALSRRYLVGPMIAIALVGVPVAQFDGSAEPSPRPSSSPSPASPVAAAARVLKLAHDAQGIYFVDNLIYAAAVGEELATLQEIEKNVVWGTDVIVQLPTQEIAASEVVILRAPIQGGGSLCMSEVSEVQDAGTYYARVAGSAKCPPHRKGMPGWTADQAAGWGSA
jgi:hypothetical protein